MCIYLVFTKHFHDYFILSSAIFKIRICVLLTDRKTEAKRTTLVQHGFLKFLLLCCDYVNRLGN